MIKDKLKETVLNEIDKNRKKIIDLGQDIMAHPELGYKEVRTSNIVKKAFSELNLDVTDTLG